MSPRVVPQQRLLVFNYPHSDVGTQLYAQIVHNPVHVFIGAQASGTKCKWVFASPAPEHVPAQGKRPEQIIVTAPGTVIVTRKTTYIGILVEVQPYGVHVQLYILASGEDSLRNPLHWFVAEIVVVRALDKERGADIVTIKRFKHEAKGFLPAINLAINCRLGNREVLFRTLEVPGDAEFSIRGDANLCGPHKVHAATRSSIQAV